MKNENEVIVLLSDEPKVFLLINIRPYRLEHGIKRAEPQKNGV